MRLSVADITVKELGLRGLSVIRFGDFVVTDAVYNECTSRGIMLKGAHSKEVRCSRVLSCLSTSDAFSKSIDSKGQRVYTLVKRECIFL